MSTPAEPESSYLQITLKMNLQWDPASPERVRLWSANAQELAAIGMTDEHGDRPGLQLVFSSNVRSADYHPDNLNRIFRVLRHAGRPAPAQDVPTRSRRLRDRWGLILDS
jgi:hypothetical protein